MREWKFKKQDLDCTLTINDDAVIKLKINDGWEEVREMSQNEAKAFEIVRNQIRNRKKEAENSLPFH